MTDRDPRIAWAFRFVACAVKAKSGPLSHRDQLALLRHTLQFMRHDDDAVQAVMDFIDTVEIDATAAGALAHDWILTRFPRANAAANQIEQFDFEWQARADFQ